MNTAPVQHRRPPAAVLAAVVLVHAMLLMAPPRQAAPTPAPKATPAMWTRAVAPAPPQVAAAAPMDVPRMAPPPAEPAAAQNGRAPVRSSPKPVTAMPRRIGAEAVPARAQQPPSARAAAPPASPAASNLRTDAAATLVANQTAPGDAVTAASEAASGVSAPVRVPGAATLHYVVQGQMRGVRYEAESELRWQREGTRYDAVWTVAVPVLGTRWQRSEGAITSAGLAPERFGEKARGERAAHFDAAGGRIRFSANTPDAALQPGAQDRLSTTLQLGALLAAAPERYPAGTQIAVQTAGAREAEAWIWAVQADETLQLAGQTLPSAKLLREPRREYDSRIELWLARTLDHLPVRLRVTQSNGDVIDQQLSAVAHEAPRRAETP